MDLYTVSLATGAVGLGLMGIGGLSHGAHAGHVRGGHAHAGHSIGTQGLASGMGARGVRSAGTGTGWRWTSLLSPRFLFRFESRSAVTLESSIEDEARAVTGFDANGNCLVSLEVDGQVVQLLATLAPDERARGIRIHSGDLVRVAEVDAERGDAR